MRRRASWPSWPLAWLSGPGHALEHHCSPAAAWHWPAPASRPSLRPGAGASAAGWRPQLRGAAIALSTLPVLGSYRIGCQATPVAAQRSSWPPGRGAAAQRQGAVGGRRLAVPRRGRAAEGAEAALNNLLNIIGRRQGAAPSFRSDDHDSLPRPRHGPPASSPALLALAGAAAGGHAAAGADAQGRRSRAPVTVNFVNADIEAVTRAFAAMLDRRSWSTRA
jgi:hypothetical protein